MEKTVHLVVAEGPDKRLKLSVPLGGARLGRSAKNDFMLTDPKLSRHHCRFFFTPETGLCVADLGSSNQTLVNDRPIQETRLVPGDRIMIGDTTLRVVNNGVCDMEPTSVPEVTSEEGDIRIDLGLKPSSSIRRISTTPKFGVKKLLIIATVVLVGAVALLILGHRPSTEKTKTSDIKPVVEKPELLSIEYEKVQADTNGIFRYHFTLTEEGVLTITVDNTEKTHLLEEDHVEIALLKELQTFIKESGFFDLDETYSGLQPDVLEEKDISITIGYSTHRSKVLNRTEPDVFKRVRLRLENFGQVELGLWAIQYPAEKLLEMAQNSYLRGQKLYDEREVTYGNLAAAISSFKEAKYFLSTVDPKPDYYADLLSQLAECIDLLKEKYLQQNFRSERAIRLKAFKQAAEELRTLMEIIGDRSDPRFLETETKLLEVESRLKMKR